MKRTTEQYIEDSEAYQEFCKEHNLTRTIEGFKEFVEEVNSES